MIRHLKKALIMNIKTTLLAVALSALVVGCSSEKIEVADVKSVEPITELTDTQRQTITDYFLSDSEPTVLDATWTDDKIFKIGVKDDGSNRDGFADYACSEINNNLGGKDQGVWVQIIDYNKLMKTKDWVKLGEAHC